MVAYTFLCSGSLIAIIQSMTGIGSCSSCWVMEFLIAKPTRAILFACSLPCHSKRMCSSKASAKISVSVVHTCWEFHLVLGQCCLELCPVRWCWVCVRDKACEKCYASSSITSDESTNRCRTEVYSKHRLCIPGSWYFPSASYFSFTYLTR